MDGSEVMAHTGKQTIQNIVFYLKNEFRDAVEIEYKCVRQTGSYFEFYRIYMDVRRFIDDFENNIDSGVRQSE